MQTPSMNAAVWRKSSRSNGNGGNNCVEVAKLADGCAAVRHSRHPQVPALIFTAAEWEAFLGGARDGEFD